jgi:uncharacterized protein (DUF1330 family)
VEFDSLDRAKAWYNAAEYRPLIELRQRSADMLLVLVGGI